MYNFSSSSCFSTLVHRKNKRRDGTIQAACFVEITSKGTITDHNGSANSHKIQVFWLNVAMSNTTFDVIGETLYVGMHAPTHQSCNDQAIIMQTNNILIFLLFWKVYSFCSNQQ